jgi:2-keto-4-pentenoate hydratase
MNASPIKIQQGMRRQLQSWRESIARGGQHLGWKVGYNMQADQLRLNLPSAMVGFLSSERRLDSGAHYLAPTNAMLMIEPEVAILMGSDVPANASAAQAGAAIAACTAALELVDTTRSVNDDMEEILAGNLFHERVVLGEQQLAANAFVREQLSLSLRINGAEVRTLEPARVPQDFSTIVRNVATILALHGEQLQQGDWIITGAAAKPAPVQVGDVITLAMGQLGTVELEII